MKPEEAPAEPKAAEPEEIPVAIESVPKLAVAVEYLRDICGRMADGELTFDCIKTGETYIVRIDGEGAGALIGHRGEVMESLSYLASLAANRTEGLDRSMPARATCLPAPVRAAWMPAV